MSDVPGPIASLRLRGFGVAFGEQVVLAAIDLDLGPTGVVNLLGPAGAGKSTLLRTLSGANHAQPSLRMVGEASLMGVTPGGLYGAALVGQNARLVVATVLENLLSGVPDRLAIPTAEHASWAASFLDELGLSMLRPLLRASVVSLPLGTQRLVGIARTLAGGPRVLLLDEPTVGLGDDEVEPLLALIRREGGRRLVVVVTHNQGHAARLGGEAILLAGGRVIEHAATSELLGAPRTRPAQDFVRTGSCAVASLTTPPEDLAPEFELPPPLPAELARRASCAGPRHFHWIITDALAGLPRPGLIDDVEHDLDMLRALGVTRLVTLEERQTVGGSLLAARGIAGQHFPVDDMGAPGLELAIAHCRETLARIEQGEVVAYHCRAGLGRTGTLLAAVLIVSGLDAISAIDSVRRSQPRFIQSDKQISFLDDLHRRMIGAGEREIAPSFLGQ
ncbi:MAG: ATP-binding cassette domain-containing protein [Deltaproteobacteria bacterium]|nr:ATP-binding cassette domain-containing protein [Deltaproteobacteria bacterium]